MRVSALVPLLCLCLSASVASAEVPAFKCLGAKITKAQIGNMGKYESKEGLAVNQQSGFINRSDIAVEKGCFFPDVKPGQTVVMWFDKKTYDKVTKGTSMYPGMQCVFLDDNKPLAPSDVPGTGGAAPKDILTKCPNETGYPCDAGSNSDRNSKYKATLAKDNLILQSFTVRTSDNMDTMAARKGEWDGRDVFCQSFDKKSGAVLFATQFKMAKAEKK